MRKAGTGLLRSLLDPRPLVTLLTTLLIWPRPSSRDCNALSDVANRRTNLGLMLHGLGQHCLEHLVGIQGGGFHLAPPELEYFWASSLHVLAAVDRDVSTSHEGGLVGAKVDDQAGDLVRCSEAPKRNLRKNL